MNPVDPENLIYRFARQLEFGNRTMQVAKEACRIVQRMNRDWMTTGRRPAGICGAALILAARMNNFRRTVREVVYVVKVTEVTINQRLNEFSSTDSGELTIDQFRSVHLENAHDPPSFTQGKAGKDRKRKAPENAADIEDDEESTHTHTHRKNRVDADGFAVPDLPIDPRLLGNRDPPATDSGQKRKPASSGDGEDNFSADMSRPLRKKNRTDRESSLDESVSIDAVETAESSTAEQSAEASSQPKPKRGRPKKVPPPPPTAEELASEEALEDEMNQFLAQGSDMIEVVAKETETPVLKKPVSESRDIDASEFDSDPEVANCLLSAAEVEIKERIWVHENKDYLRTQQAKALKRALLQVEGEENGGVKPRRRRKGRLGDVTYLEGEDGTSSRASTPAEATRLMLEKRGFSKKINYKLLESLYGEEGAQQVAKAKAELASRSSRSQSVASQGSIIAEPSISDPKIAATAVSTESSAEHSSAHVPTQSSSKSIFQLDGDEGDDEYGDDGYEGDGDDGYGDNDQARIQAALGGDYGEEEQQQEEEDYYDQASDYDYD
jgi:transcription factor IIIB subunit 2